MMDKSVCDILYCTSTLVLLQLLQHAPLRVLATLEHCNTRRHVKRFKAIDTRSLSCQTKGIKHEPWLEAVPVEHSTKRNLICHLETKPWGHLSASAWLHLCSCYFSRLRTEAKTENKRTAVSVKNTSVTQYPSAPLAPRYTQHTWLMAHVPHASFTWHQDFRLKPAFEQKWKNCPHACQSLSPYFQKVPFAIGNPVFWMKLTDDIWYTELLGNSFEARTSIRLHKLFLLYVKSDRLQLLLPDTPGF